MSLVQLVGPGGKPVSSRDGVVCPRCGEGARARSIHTFFGGWWKRICECGYVYETGQGVPPVED
jgi:hypothetical protein